MRSPTARSTPPPRMAAMASNGVSDLLIPLCSIFPILMKAPTPSMSGMAPCLLQAVLESLLQLLHLPLPSRPSQVALLQLLLRRLTPTALHLPALTMTLVIALQMEKPSSSTARSSMEHNSWPTCAPPVWVPVSMLVLPPMVPAAPVSTSFHGVYRIALISQMILGEANSISLTAIPSLSRPAVSLGQTQTAAGACSRRHVPARSEATSILLSDCLRQS